MEMKELIENAKMGLREAWEEDSFIGTTATFGALMIIIMILTGVSFVMGLVYNAVIGDTGAIIGVCAIIFFVAFFRISYLWAFDKLPKFRRSSPEWDEFLEWKAENDKIVEVMNSEILTIEVENDARDDIAHLRARIAVLEWVLDKNGSKNGNDDR